MLLACARCKRVYAGQTLNQVYYEEFYVSAGWTMSNFVVDSSLGRVERDFNSAPSSMYKDLGLDLRNAIIKVRYRNSGSAVSLKVWDTDRKNSCVLFQKSWDTHLWRTSQWTVSPSLSWEPRVLEWSFDSSGGGGTVDFIEVTKYSDGAAPPVVSGLQVAPGVESLNISWASGPPASGYVLWIDGQTIDVGQATSYIASRLTPRTKVSVSVQAYNEWGSGTFCPPASATVSEGALVRVYRNDYSSSTGLELGGFEVDPHAGWALKSSNLPAYLIHDIGVDLRGALVRVRYRNQGSHVEFSVMGQENTWVLHSEPDAASDWHTEEWFVPPSLDWAPTRFRCWMDGSRTSGLDYIEILQSQLPLPSKIAGLEGVVDGTTATLRWNRDPYAYGYRLVIDGHMIDVGSALTWDIPGILPGSTLGVSVQGYNRSGEGPFSELLEIAVQGEPVSPGGNEPPEAAGRVWMEQPPVIYTQRGRITP